MTLVAFFTGDDARRLPNIQRANGGAYFRRQLRPAHAARSSLLYHYKQSTHQPCSFYVAARHQQTEQVAACSERCGCVRCRCAYV